MDTAEHVAVDALQLPRVTSRARVPLVPLLALLALVAAWLLLPPPVPEPVAVPDVLPPHVWEPGVLRVGMDTSYPPFASEHEGRFDGHDVALARRLAQHVGRRLVIVSIPYDGLYDALRISRIDVIISALPKTPEFEGSVIYSRPYFEAGEVLVARAGAVLPGSGVTGLVVGTELGSVGDQTGRLLLHDGANFTLLSSYRTVDAAVAALQAGELDAVLLDRVSALALVSRESSLQIVGKPLSSVPYVIALPYDTPELASDVNSWLAALESSGELARLTDEYLATP